jgi:Ribbon-helix-helix protein, copG family
MLTSVKLPDELRAELETAARRLGLAKSAFIRRALSAEIAHARAEAGPTPYEFGRDLFGKTRSRNLSATRARKLIANATRAARSHR